MSFFFLRFKINKFLLLFLGLLIFFQDFRSNWFLIGFCVCVCVCAHACVYVCVYKCPDIDKMIIFKFILVMLKKKSKVKVFKILFYGGQIFFF